MPLVEDDALERGEEFSRGLAGEEERERLGRRHEDIGEAIALAGSGRGGGVAGASFDGEGEAHLEDREREGLFDVAGDGSERRDVEDADAGERSVCAALVDHRCEGAHVGGVGLAGAGGDLDEAGVAGGEGGPCGALEGPGRPGARREPRLDLGQSRGSGDRHRAGGACRTPGDRRARGGGGSGRLGHARR